MALKRNHAAADAGPIKTGNPYLDKPEKGLALVSSIISKKPGEAYYQKQRYRRVDHLLDRKLLSYTHRLELNDALKLYSELVILSDQLRFPWKYRILQDRAVIGLGGKFSAGKSQFINSILGAGFKNQLPVDQAPSTSVPTYIVSGDSNQVLAYTKKGAQVKLDNWALAAISHEFQTTYGLGLAQYMDFIAVFAEDFQDNIALLDTPGYNKPDASLVEDYSDLQQAYSQLQAIDYLIWLVSVENGTLTDNDIRFMEKLNLRTKILIVVNKCDLKTESESRRVAEQVEKAARNAGLPIFDVIRYSSFEPDEYQGAEYVGRFFRYAQKRESKAEDIQRQFLNISKKFEGAFQATQGQRVEERDALGKLIFRANNIFEISALVTMYGDINSDIDIIRKNEKKFQKAKKEISDSIRDMLREERYR